MPKTILVVDDDDGVLEVVKCVLETEGYDVIASPNSKPIFSKEAKQPHMILLDVLLSGEDGREIARKLKGQVSTKDIPLVMMSAHPKAKDATKQAGADAFLPKPFDIDNLLNLVSKYVNRQAN